MSEGGEAAHSGVWALVADSWGQKGRRHEVTGRGYYSTVAAGYGHNGIGITGAAPNASLSGLRLIAGGTTDSTEADALKYALDSVDIYSNSWGPDDDGTISPIGPLLSQSLGNGVANGRDGKGAIYTWAGGNGRASFDNSNYAVAYFTMHLLAQRTTLKSNQHFWFMRRCLLLLIHTPLIYRILNPFQSSNEREEQRLNS